MIFLRVDPKRPRSSKEQVLDIAPQFDLRGMINDRNERVEIRGDWFQRRGDVGPPQAEHAGDLKDGRGVVENDGDAEY